MEQKTHEFKVGDIVRVTTGGPGSGHMLKKGEFVKIVRLEGIMAFTVQASAQKSFRNAGGWSRDDLGDRLQHLNDDDVEFAFSGPSPQIALSSEKLPLI